MPIKIQDHIISRDSSPFIIAEAGINHNGDFEKAKKMIKIAKDMGADAIKFQTFNADEFVSNKTLTYTYTSQGKEITESMYDMFKRTEFSKEQWYLIKQECDKQKIIFLSTAQNYSDLKLLLELQIPAIKVGSDDFTNLPLLKKYATTKLPIILSCGMADQSEIIQSLESVGALDGYPTILLLCTSEYPTPPEDVNILKLNTLNSILPDIPLGFSDHTRDNLAASLAVGLGATVFEKHFTIDHNLPGPDHWFSADPPELKLWIDSIRQSFRMRGSHILQPTESEKNMRILSRRSITAIKDMKKGDILDETNIGLKRPGDGIAPKYFEEFLGKKITCDINEGTQIKKSDVE